MEKAAAQHTRAIVWLLVVAVCAMGLVACERSAPPTTAAPAVAQTAPPPEHPELQPFSEPFSFGRVRYYHQGKLYLSHVDAFETCTMPGDYMLVRREKRYRTQRPVLGIRITRLTTNQPQTIDDRSFVATVAGRTLTPRIRKLADGEPGLWTFAWDLDPSWREVRIDQNAEVTFQLHIAEGGVDWSKLPEAFRKVNPETGQPDKVCFP